MMHCRLTLLKISPVSILELIRLSWTNHPFIIGKMTMEDRTLITQMQAAFFGCHYHCSTLGIQTYFICCGISSPNRIVIKRLICNNSNSSGS